ncbi:MFS transporter [Actinophytocola algeriensis]|uniref:Putative MFS family arabinose efflux permease n=1 Tax=Actinophytocola algeriensis TaxID=1768010 RepID=A0A7W7VDI7_9PSEU|nr:MFS transporter [Actinophytocola algeriensis]MBB4906207.1 putative MFS family arabinose efflux permease [Actinophytocola algeriensis]MBE1472108.1 putative MFS family arabinose efflux permease [Actinophytocola algeriensis]
MKEGGGRSRAESRDDTGERSRPDHPSAVALAVAGSAAVATAFGMARYGYGLLLPDIQDDLVLTPTMLGAIGTLAYAAYVVTTTLVGRCVVRVGQRATVVVGGLLAVVGTIIIAMAHDPVVLAIGVGTAGASAGLVQPPFADAVDRLPATIRARTLATISCGTGWGVAVAAPIAIAAGDEWRGAYLGFAACALASTLFAVYVLGPGRTVQPSAQGGPPRRRPAPRPGHGVTPMLVGALLVGLGSAPFWTFAVDTVRDAGLDQTAGRVLLGVTGVASVLAMGTADVIRRLGAARTFVLCALLEAVAIATVGLAPSRVGVVLIAAAAFGAAYSMLVNVSVLWGTRLYPDQPSVGSARAVGAQAAGLLCGPVIGGLVADLIGLTATLLGGAVVVVMAAFFAPRGDVIQNAAR